MPQYSVLKHLYSKGLVYEPPATVELSEKDGEFLQAEGVVGDAVESGPSKPADPEVPKPPAGDTGDKPADPGDDLNTPLLINLNTADNAALQSLPHIGKGLAARIEKFRPYTALESAGADLGLTPQQWEEILPLVTI